MKTKICRKCGEERAVNAFGKDKSRKDGRTVHCKDCQRLYRKRNASKIAETKKKCYLAKKDHYLNYQKEYREENPEKVSEIKKKCYEAKPEHYRSQGKRYREENKELIRERKKKYREENPEKERERKKKWSEANREYKLARDKEYREDNQEKLKQYHKDYHQKNKKHRNAQNRKRDKERIATDPEYRTARQIRVRAYGALRHGLNHGSGVRNLGCSVKQFMQHIESQFYADENGVMMSWENRGAIWHVDHIYPLAAADKNDPIEVKAVCNWCNQQPLTIAENFAKGDKVTPEAQKLFNKLKKEFSKKKAG